MNRRRLYTFSIAALLLLGGALFTMETPRYFRSIPTQDKIVFLTFDGHVCDPSPLHDCTNEEGRESVEKLLDTLKSLDIRLTLFLTAEFVDRYPDLTLRALREGHEIGSHLNTHTHPLEFRRRGIVFGKEWFLDELLSVDKAIRKISNDEFHAVPLYRMPFGIEEYAVIRGAIPSILAWGSEAGYTHIGWSADTLDWVTAKARARGYPLPRYLSSDDMKNLILSRVDQNQGQGVIVLSHLVRYRSAQETTPNEMLPALIAELKTRNYGVARVFDYLSPGTSSQPSPFVEQTETETPAEAPVAENFFTCNYRWPGKQVSICIRGISAQECGYLLDDVHMFETRTCVCLDKNLPYESITGEGYAQISCAVR